MHADPAMYSNCFLLSQIDTIKSPTLLYRVMQLYWSAQQRHAILSDRGFVFLYNYRTWSHTSLWKLFICKWPKVSSVCVVCVCRSHSMYAMYTIIKVSRPVGSYTCSVNFTAPVATFYLYSGWKRRGRGSKIYRASVWPNLPAYIYCCIHCIHRIHCMTFAYTHHTHTWHLRSFGTSRITSYSYTNDTTL